jgi:hypothetical protein
LVEEHSRAYGMYGEKKCNHMLQDRYNSPNVMWLRSIVMHVAIVEEKEVLSRFWWGNMKEEEHMEESGIDGWMI